MQSMERRVGCSRVSCNANWTSIFIEAKCNTKEEKLNIQRSRTKVGFFRQHVNTHRPRIDSIQVVAPPRSIAPSSPKSAVQHHLRSMCKPKMDQNINRIPIRLRWWYDKNTAWKSLEVQLLRYQISLFWLVILRADIWNHQESCFSGLKSFLFQQQGALLFYLFEFFSQYI